MTTNRNISIKHKMAEKKSNRSSKLGTRSSRSVSDCQTLHNKPTTIVLIQNSTKGTLGQVTSTLL